MAMSRVALHLDVVRALMRSQGWTDATSLARSAHLGPTTVRRIIRGDSPIVGLDVAERLADALRVDVEIIGQPIGDLWVLGPHGVEPLARSLARMGMQR